MYLPLVGDLIKQVVKWVTYRLQQGRAMSTSMTWQGFRIFSESGAADEDAEEIDDSRKAGGGGWDTASRSPYAFGCFFVSRGNAWLNLYFTLYWIVLHDSWCNITPVSPLITRSIENITVMSRDYKVISWFRNNGSRIIQEYPYLLLLYHVCPFTIHHCICITDRFILCSLHRTSCVYIYIYIYFYQF